MTYEVGLVVVAREGGEVPGVVEPAEGEVPPGVVVGPVEGLVVSLEGGGVDPPVRQLLSAGGRSVCMGCNVGVTIRTAVLDGDGSRLSNGTGGIGERKTDRSALRTGVE